MKKKQEFIICSAVWFKDEYQYSEQPINVGLGFVVCGRRHNNCFQVFNMINKDFTITKENTICGFLTNTNRFVDRKEGFVIAQKQNQLLYPELHNKDIEIRFLNSEKHKLDEPILTSEDLFIYDEKEIKY